MKQNGHTTTGELLDQKPPSDPDAEAAVLGACIIDTGTIDRHDIRAEHFHEHRYRVLLAHIALLRENLVPIDPAHLLQSLKETGDHEKIGGGECSIAEAIEAAVVRSKFPEYLARLHDMAARRAVLTLGIDAIKAAHSRKATAVILDEAQTSLANAKSEAEYLERGAKPLVVPMSTVQSQSLEWFWPSRFPRGKFCLMIGDPGDGKSLVAAYMTACATTGGCWPSSVDCATYGRVLLICCEDDPGDTIKPRLEVAGADMSKVDLLQTVSYSDPNTGEQRERLPNLQLDIALIDQILARGSYVLAVFDTITGFLGKVDNNSSTDVRNALTPLSVLAAKHGTCIIGVQHLTKNTATAARYRTNGSVAYNALARAVVAVARDHRDRDLRILVGVKTNLGPPPISLGFYISTKDTPEGKVPYIDWQGPIEADADELLGPPPAKSPKKDAAADWLLMFLAHGPQLASEVIDAAKEAGHSEKTIRRAKEDLGILASKAGVKDGWTWALPSEGAPTLESWPSSENHEENHGHLRTNGNGHLGQLAIFEDGQAAPKMANLNPQDGQVAPQDGQAENPA